MSDPAVMELRAKRGVDPDTLNTTGGILAAVVCDREWSTLLDQRAERHLAILTRYADAIKQLRPNWQTASDELAQEIREIERVLVAGGQPAGAAPSEMVKPIDAARRLGMVKPCGKRPTGKFYEQVLPLIGTKVGSRYLITKARLDAYTRGDAA